MMAEMNVDLRVTTGGYVQLKAHRFPPFARHNKKFWEGSMPQQLSRWGLAFYGSTGLL
jgi:hypothetical protein